MTRSNLSTANADEAAAPAVRAAMLLDIAFPSGTLYATTAERPIIYNGIRYNPSGIFNGSKGITETSDLKPKRISINLSGVDSGLKTKLVNDAYHYAETNLYLAFCDENWKPVADPYPLGESLIMSGAVITLDQDAGTVEVSAETLDIFNQRSSAALATPESQKLRYAGDTGMDAVRPITEAELIWAGRYLGGAGAGNPAGGRPGNVGGLIKQT